MLQLRTCPPPVSRRLTAALLAAAVLTAGVALGQSRKPDPVEEFRRALLLEHNIKNEDKAALAYRKQNLKERADQVRSLADLSRVLLLSEWQTDAAAGFRSTSYFDFEVRLAESQVRQDLTKRFADEVKKVLQSRDPDVLAAGANLLSETVVGASSLGAANTLARERLFLYTQLAALAPNLVPLTRNPSAEVRVAAARALGNFPTESRVVVGALRDMLDAGRWDVRTRLAAADALRTLVQVVSGRQGQQRSSEPGVGMRPDQARSFAFRPADEIKVYDVVVPAAAKGLADPDPAVRLACMNALRQVTLSLVEMIPNVELAPEYVNLPGLPYPAPGRREWTRQERARVNEGRARVREIHQALDRVLPEFRSHVQSLTRASADSDAEVRIRARQALEDLALVQRLLRNLDAFVPPDPAPALPPPDKVEQAPANSLPGVTLGAPRKVAAPARAALARPVAAGKSELVLVRLEQPAPDKKEAAAPAADQLAAVVDQARRALIEGTSDPDPKGRLAAVDALELFGALAEPAIPELAAALGDRNKFVRWSAARALGRLGEALARQDKSEAVSRAAREALPGLLRLLCDPDLDVRVAALDSLRRFGPRVPEAVPALTALLGRGDTEARVGTLQALAAIGPAAVPSLPAVARALQHPDPRLRGEAARTLGSFGKAAAPFVAALRQAMEDRDPDVRKAASEAILQITLGQ